LEPPMDLLISN